MKFMGQLPLDLGRHGVLGRFEVGRVDRLPLPEPRIAHVGLLEIARLKKVTEGE